MYINTWRSVNLAIYLILVGLELVDIVACETRNKMIKAAGQSEVLASALLHHYV